MEENDLFSPLDRQRNTYRSFFFSICVIVLHGLYRLQLLLIFTIINKIGCPLLYTYFNETDGTISKKKTFNLKKSEDFILHNRDYCY